VLAEHDSVVLFVVVVLPLVLSEIFFGEDVPWTIEDTW
jgi:hypothetical protein